MMCFPDGGLAFVTTQTTMMIVRHMSRSDPPINPSISSKFIVSPSALVVVMYVVDFVVHGAGVVVVDVVVVVAEVVDDVVVSAVVVASAVVSVTVVVMGVVVVGAIIALYLRRNPRRLTEESLKNLTTTELLFDVKLYAGIFWNS